MFPFRQEWDESLRVGGTETLHQWFRRVIGPNDAAQVTDSAMRD